MITKFNTIKTRKMQYIFESSHGRIITDDAGYVREIHRTDCDCDLGEPCILGIHKFNIDEMFQYLKKQGVKNPEFIESYDILNCGYWLNNGTYTPPDENHRGYIYGNKLLDDEIEAFINDCFDKMKGRYTIGTFLNQFSAHINMEQTQKGHRLLAKLKARLNAN